MMKKEMLRAVKLLATVVLIFVAANSVAAQAYEPFSYRPGTPISSGPNGGTGWSGGWNTGTGAITNGGLSYPGLPVTGNALGPSGNFTYRLLQQPITDCSMRLAVLIRSDTNGTPGTQATVGNFGAPIGSSFTIGDLPQASPQAGNWGMQIANGQNFYSNVPVVAGETTYLVAQIDFNYSGANERFRLWVNPPALANLATGTLPAIPALEVTNLNIASFNGVYWQTQQGQSVDEIRVERIPCGCCDTMRVTPVVNPPLNQDYRTFEIFNPSSPASPICSVDINMTPDPHTLYWQGGQAFQNIGVGNPSTPVNFTFGSNPPAYRRLPTLAPNVMSAISNPVTSPALRFNLGFDNTQAYNGVTTLTVNHCDGRKCILEYRPWIVTPMLSSDTELTAWRFNIRELSDELLEVTLTYDGERGKSELLPEANGARWLGLRLLKEDVEVYSIDGSEITTEKRESGKFSLSSSAMTPNGALFEFNGLLTPEQNGRSITLLLKRKNGATLESKGLRLTLFDENANAIIAGIPQQ
jgi:hypothetical protein